MLNADFRPLSYFPLSLWSWQETVKAVMSCRVAVVSEYDRVIHSPSRSLRLPSVVSLKDYAPTARRPAFTRFNLFLRDRFTCQYCGRAFATAELTFDHVIPRSRGGATCWTNVVAACAACNLAKADKLPREAGMRLLVPPSEPSGHRLQSIGRAFTPDRLHQSWRDFLYWDSELETG